MKPSRLHSDLKSCKDSPPPLCIICPNMEPIMSIVAHHRINMPKWNKDNQLNLKFPLSSDTHHL